MPIAVDLDDLLIKNAASIFEMMVMVGMEKTDNKDLAIVEEERLGVITFEGPTHGCLGILCSKECAGQLAANMLCVDDPATLSIEEVDDAIREITNMVMGAIKADPDINLNEVQLSIPVVIRGREIEHDLGERPERISVMTLVDGRFPVELTLLWSQAVA